MIGVLLTAGLIASAPAATTADPWPTYVSVGVNPIPVEISPSGALAHVTNAYNRTVSLIDTASKTVTATANVGVQPQGIAFTPDSGTAHITNAGDCDTDNHLVQQGHDHPGMLSTQPSLHQQR